MRTQRNWIFSLLLAFSVGAAVPARAQESDPPAQSPSSGWRRLGEFGQPTPTVPADPLPPSSTLTLPAGIWITVRVDQPLSSDRNQSGDAFTATLAQPLVVNGRVIARRGQTVGGVVAQAEKAGRVKGTSRLGVELTEIGFVDGRQIQVKTRLMERRGDTSVGRDVGAVGATTGIGAAIGAAADGGFGAGMGAIAGAAASAIGVLVTRGRATEVYPEDPVTFRLEAPVAISAENAEAFPPVTQEDYERRSLNRERPTLGPPNASPYYSYYYPPFFYGPSFLFYSGPRFYHRGFYRRW